MNVQRKYRSVWIAAGEYRGERIEVKEKTEGEAVAAWQRAAKTKSDRDARTQ